MNLKALPGGNSAIYYAHQLFKFVSCGKYNKDDDGFDGFKIRCELIKSRTNKAGQSTHLVYNQLTGFDALRTLYEFAVERELVDGRNPYKYFKGYKDIKFDSRNFKEELNNSEELKTAFFTCVQPHLHKMLSHIGEEEKVTHNDILSRLIESQEAEE